MAGLAMGSRKRAFLLSLVMAELVWCERLHEKMLVELAPATPNEVRDVSSDLSA